MIFGGKCAFAGVPEPFNFSWDGFGQLQNLITSQMQQSHDPLLNIPTQQIQYHIAKSPAQRDVSVPQLMTAHGAVDFLPALQVFLKSASSPTIITPFRFDHFDLYKQVTIT
jgi:hypothetical protein